MFVASFLSLRAREDMASCFPLRTLLAGIVSLGCALGSCLQLTPDSVPPPRDMEGGADAEAGPVDSLRDGDASQTNPADSADAIEVVDSLDVDVALAVDDAHDSDANLADSDAADPKDADAADADAADADAADADAADADAADADAADADAADADGADADAAAKKDDAGDGSIDADSEATPSPSEFYVDPGASEGSAAFRTITAALAAADLSSAATRTIHVAPGTYSLNSGESFPLVVRGVSLVGSGASTVVVGMGSIPGVGVPTFLRTDGTEVALSTNPVNGAFVVGDKSKQTTIAHLAVESSVQGAPSSEGIVCDRGSTAGSGRTPPNSLINDVLITGFEVGLRVTYSLAPVAVGCAALLTSSTLENGSYGIVADGWARTDGSPLQRVSVQIGDGIPSDGNVIHDFVVTTGALKFAGAGVATREAVTGVVISSNHFTNSDQAIWMAQRVGSAGDSSDIEQNDFGPLRNAGMLLMGPVAIDPLVGNTFHDITASGTLQNFPGTGLIVEGDPSPPFPTVRARSNTFFGNDCGIQIRSYMNHVIDTLPDFGTATESGMNVIRCNFGTVGAFPTGDVFVYLPASPAGVKLPFEGNIWDHAPPLIGPPPQGNDVIVLTGPPVDTARALSANQPTCPTGRSP
jgi:Protein of unknown function (DUF1565)